MNFETSNELLAQGIQDGNTGLYAQLWAQTQRYFTAKAVKCYRSRYGRFVSAGVVFEDLKQAAFLALADAVRAYDREKETKLLSYSVFPLQNRFNELLGTHGNTDGENKPLNGALSLNVPLYDGETATEYADVLPDEAAELEVIQAAEEQDNEQRRQAVAECLESLTEDERTVIQAHYFDEMPMKNISAIMHLNAYELRKIALKKLRKPENARKLRLFIEDGANELIEAAAFKGVGTLRFKETQSSSVERTFELLFD